MSDRSERLTLWFLNFLVVLYIVWSAHTLAVRAVAFGGMFTGLNAELPVPTIFAIRACAAPWPYVAAALLSALLLLFHRAVKSPAIRACGSVAVLLVAAWG